MGRNERPVMFLIASIGGILGLSLGLLEIFQFHHWFGTPNDFYWGLGIGVATMVLILIVGAIWGVVEGEMTAIAIWGSEAYKAHS